MSQSTNGKMLKGRDLITVGIFSAIYFVINFVFMLMSGFHPMIWILMPALIALFTGVPFMLMCAKVQKPSAVILMGLITGLLYFVTGQFTVVILATFVIGCVLGEIARAATKYNSFKGNTIAFALFSIGMTGSPLPIWIMREGFLAQITQQGMPADYVATLKAVSSPVMLVVMIVAPLVTAVIGAVLAKGMFKKHFTKAGIV